MIHQGDCLTVLKTMQAETVDCCITSPPYYGLRDYGIDGQIGLEQTPDEYVAKLVEVFREVRRVLKDDGTLWLNIGDSYATNGGSRSYGSYDNSTGRGDAPTGNRKAPNGIKPKDLIGIPWKVVEALKAPYYSGIIKNESDRVWLAATIDAEGSITGFTHERKDDGTTRTGVHVLITNSNMLLLENAKRIWPASITSHEKHYEGHLGTMPTYCWIPHDVDKKSLLMRELYPYLIVKKDQCRLAYNFFEISKIAKHLASKPESRETHDRRAWIVQAISELNHGKDVKMPDWCIEPPTVLEPGFYLRSDIIWEKPNCMPESCKDRPTKSHEYLFLLSKKQKYYYDGEAIKEPVTGNAHRRGNGTHPKSTAPGQGIKANSSFEAACRELVPNRNKRSVWAINSQPFKEAHFATFPEKLVEPCILAGTSERGYCPGCGKPWVRQVEHKNMVIRKTDRMANMGEFGRTQSSGTMLSPAETKTIGWLPSCSCGLDPVPGVVLDPFFGAGTVGLVAKKLGRQYIGIELNPAYIEMAKARIGSIPVSLRNFEEVPA